MDDVAAQFDSIVDQAATAKDQLVGCPTVSTQVTVALQFLNHLRDKGLCGDYGCVSWSEKDGLSVMFPQVKVIRPEDAV